MKHPVSHNRAARRLAIAVRGVVQGVGFRPFVYNLARAEALAGWVQNEADTVRIEVQGDPAGLERFVDTLRNAPPSQARIESIDVEDIACDHDPDGTFQIRSSTGGAAPRPTIPADLATCNDCLKEIRTPGERRFGYPFTNCTNCGPRWSIIRQLPYDRPRTSMARFTMCPDCQAEYDNPTDRRFHAQPIACPRCGPALRLLGRNGDPLADGNESLDRAVEAVLAGQILAVKGLGGFQLVVDATNAEAVTLLRQRKQRPHKPFALMMSSLAEVRRICEVFDEEAQILSSHQAPILLLWQRRPGDPDVSVAEAVAPGNPYLGVMLPYTPLHHLLMAGIRRPIICTSGNLAEEPMAITTADALERLGPIADLFLTHNRPIVRPVDDSVGRVGPDGLELLRRARGYAPLPINLATEGPTILAVGGHLKNTVALALGSQVVMSPHVGNLIHAASEEVHRQAIRDLVGFFRVTPDLVVCDLHPDYASTRYAEQLAREWDVPLMRVQHHHAHLAACVAENGLEGPVVGFSWDGTGFGADGTVWGGEMLWFEGTDFDRIASLRTFALPGGDRAVRQPRRSALGLLFEIFGDGAAEYVADWFTQSELATLLSLLDRKVQAPRTSSMGRLFDAVAALAGLTPVISFEGQAAMALEFAADWDRQDAYPMPLADDSPAAADWEPMIRAVLADRAAGEPPGRISARFHNGLAEMAAAVARRAGCSQVVLTGGCFQNALLSRRVRARLSHSGFNVYTHGQVPPGDGGIALGQVLIAARRTRGSFDVLGNTG